MTIRVQDLASTDFSAVIARPRKRLAITHPGKFLEAEFMAPHGLSANSLANALQVPANRITTILKGQRAITADTDLRLTRYFRLTEGFFLRLQCEYDLRMQRRALGKKLDAIKPRAA